MNMHITLTQVWKVADSVGCTRLLVMQATKHRNESETRNQKPQKRIWGSEKRKSVETCKDVWYKGRNYIDTIENRLTKNPFKQIIIKKPRSDDSHTNIAVTVITAVWRGVMPGSIANFCWATRPPVIDAAVVDALIIPTLFPVEQTRDHVFPLP